MADRPSHCERCGDEAQYGAEVLAGGKRVWLCLGCDRRLQAWLKPAAKLEQRSTPYEYETTGGARG